MTDVGARLRGTLRGESVDVAAQIVVDARALVARPEAGEAASVPLGSIDGAVVRVSPEHDTLVLYLNGGEVLEVTPDASAPDGFPEIAASVLGALFALPELTRGLRAFGSPRALPGSDHDRFFAPLIDALRIVRAGHERALAAGVLGKPWRAVESLDATRAEAGVRAAIAELAANRFPTAAPDRRALEAELLDESDELLLALVALGTSERRLTAAPDETRVGAWRGWSSALAAAFAAADRSWTRSLPALCDSRGAEGRLWRRTLKP
jgi:hypothetical protein